MNPKVHFITESQNDFDLFGGSYWKDKPEITDSTIHLQDRVYLKVDLLFPVKIWFLLDYS